MKTLCCIGGVVFGVMMFFVTTVQGQTLEERIRAIETNVQRLQKEMGELKSRVDSFTSQERGSATTSVAGVAPAPLSPHSFGLDLTAYKVGETLSENLVIQEDQNGEKFISCSKRGGVLGKLEFSSIGLSNKSEVMINANFYSDTWSIVIISNRSTISLSADPHPLGMIVFANEKEKKVFKSSEIGWKKEKNINHIKIAIKADTSIFYLNDIPIHSHNLHKPETEYHTLIINGIQDTDRLFAVTWRNS